MCGQCPLDIALLLCPQRQEVGSGADVLQKFGSTPPIPIQAQNNNATNNAGGADQGFKLWREMDLHRVRLQAQEEGLPAQPHRERTHDRRLSGLWMSSLPAGQAIGPFNPTQNRFCFSTIKYLDPKQLLKCHILLLRSQSPAMHSTST